MNPMPDRTSANKADSLSLGGAFAMGTGVMIGAGIFALTGQIAELAGPLFPLAFIVGAVITGFSDVSQTWLNDVAALMNNRPRKSSDGEHPPKPWPTKSRPPNQPLHLILEPAKHCSWNN